MQQFNYIIPSLQMPAYRKVEDKKLIKIINIDLPRLTILNDIVEIDNHTAQFRSYHLLVINSINYLLSMQKIQPLIDCNLGKYQNSGRPYVPWVDKILLDKYTIKSIYSYT